MTIEHFLEKFRSKQTRTGYTTSLTQFFDFVGVKPEDYFTDGRNYEGDIVRFSEYLATKHPTTQRGKVIYIEASPKTIKTRVGAIVSYLLENDVDLGRRFWKRIKLSGEVLTNDRTPTKEELKRIMMHLDLMSRAYLLFRISSGLRIGDTLRLPFKAIDFTKNPPRFRYKNQKVNCKDIAFLTNEATETLREWITHRETVLMEIHKNGYKLLPEDEKKAVSFDEYCKKNPNSDKLFPVCKSTIYRKFGEALDKAGLGERDKQTGIRLLHDQTLRKFFRTEAGKVVSYDVAEALLGHHRSVYNKFSEKDLEEAFLKVEPFLSLGTEVISPIEIEKVQKDTDRKIRKIEHTVDVYSSLVDKLMIENQNLRDEIDQRNEAIAEQKEFEWQQHMEKETQIPKEEQLRAFQYGTQLILKKMVASGRSQQSIEKYKKTIEHGLKLIGTQGGN
jgi:hypothetical protein